METRQGLKIHHPVLQEMGLLRATVNTIMCHLPLLREDDIILLDGVLDDIGCRQYLLSMLLSIGLNTTDLCHMSSPLHLGIVHLQKSVRKTSNVFRALFSPGIQVLISWGEAEA